MEHLEARFARSLIGASQPGRTANVALQFSASQRFVRRRVRRGERLLYPSQCDLFHTLVGLRRSGRLLVTVNCA